MILKKFRQNMHILDRALRMFGGITLCVIALPGSDILGDTIFTYVLFVLGVFNILAGIVGWCANYHLLGISTCNMANKDN